MARQSRVSRWLGPWSACPLARPIPAAGSVASRAGAIFLVVVASLFVGYATGLLVPRAPPSAPSPSASPVARVLDYAVGRVGPTDDPPVILPSGLRVKSSNYRGVAIGGTIYYYNLAPQPSYDPLARGEVTADQIHVVAVVGDSPNRVLVYTIEEQ